MKAQSSVYISCPLTMPTSYLKQVAHRLIKKDYSVKFYDRESKYSSDDLLSSQAVVVILPGAVFQEPLKDISKGVASEIQLAADNKIPLYVAYTPTGSDFPIIYNATIDGSGFTGIIGTGGDFFGEIPNSIDVSDSKTSEAKDKRLLLS